MASETPERSETARKYKVFVDNEYFEVEVEEVGGAPVVRRAAPAAPAAAPAAAPKAAPAAAPAPAAAAVEGTPIVAPMPGMIISFEKEVGDAVEAGDTVVILEAMKMENALTAPVAGTIKAINYDTGDSVPKDAVLCVIG